MNSRSQSLDVLRGVAILLVLVRHYPTHYLWYVHQLGWSGVDLFFVLSGFLISGLLFTEYKQYGTISVTRFWIRRGFKIYPPFYFLLVCTALLFLLRIGRIPHQLLFDALFVQNYFNGIWQHGWSLAVEEHFYFGLPLLLAAMAFARKRNPFKLIPTLSILSAVLCLFLRIRFSSNVTDFYDAFFLTHFRFDALLMGVAISYFWHFEPRSIPKHRWPMALVGGLLVLPNIFGRTLFAAGAGLTLTSVGYGCILLAAIDRKPSRSRILRGLAFVGYYSYSIYLWHPALLIWFERLDNPSLRMQLLYDCCAIALGVTMAKLVELPSLKIRDKYFPSTALRVEQKSEKLAESGRTHLEQSLAMGPDALETESAAA